MKKYSLSLLTSVVALTISANAFAGGQGELLHQEWKHKGFFGAYDKSALVSGYNVYKTVCSACHALKFLSYRNLADLGYNDDEIKEIAAEYTVMDGPNDDGEMFERQAVPADRFVSPFANDKAARAGNNGALPPDLSLIIKSRAGGENYIYSLLMGYEDEPEDVELMDGMSYNKYFPGHQIAMAQPLMDGQVTYPDGSEVSQQQAAKDVVQFLAWASEPHLESRKRMGIKVMIFMLAFAFIMYGAKRRIWSNLK